MRTLWTFGDSYTEPYGYGSDDWDNGPDNRPFITDNWLDLICKNIKVKNHNFYGKAGTALSYTYYKFDQSKCDMQINDVVIIVLTDVKRKWFDQDNPNHGPYWDYNVTHMTADEYEAGKKYLLYLDKNPLMEEIYLKNFLESVHNITKEKNLTTIVIAGFDYDSIEKIKHEYPLIHFPNDSLLKITHGEINSEYNQIVLGNEDKRHNHMTKSNHFILANKITNFILYREPIIIDDFVTNTITKKFFNNIELQKYELFGKTWNIGKL